MKGMLKKFYKGKTGNLYIQILRYLVSGITAFAVDFALLYLLTDVFEGYYLTSSLISFSVGLIITYLFSILWIFNQRRLNRKAEILIFALIGTIGLVLTYWFMRFFTDFLNVHYLVSKIFTTTIIFVWNFIAKRVILFSSRKVNKSESQ